MVNSVNPQLLTITPHEILEFPSAEMWADDYVGTAFYAPRYINAGENLLSTEVNFDPNGALQRYMAIFSLLQNGGDVRKIFNNHVFDETEHAYFGPEPYTQPNYSPEELARESTKIWNIYCQTRYKYNFERLSEAYETVEQINAKHRLTHFRSKIGERSLLDNNDYRIFPPFICNLVVPYSNDIPFHIQINLPTIYEPRNYQGRYVLLNVEQYSDLTFGTDYKSLQLAVVSEILNRYGSFEKSALFFDGDYICFDSLDVFLNSIRTDVVATTLSTAHQGPNSPLVFQGSVDVANNTLHKLESPLHAYMQSRRVLPGKHIKIKSKKAKSKADKPQLPLL